MAGMSVSARQLKLTGVGERKFLGRSVLVFSCRSIFSIFFKLIFVNKKNQFLPGLTTFDLISNIFWFFRKAAATFEFSIRKLNFQMFYIVFFPPRSNSNYYFRILKLGCPGFPGSVSSCLFRVIWPLFRSFWFAIWPILGHMSRNKKMRSEIPSSAQACFILLKLQFSHPSKKWLSLHIFGKGRVLGIFSVIFTSSKPARI